MTYEDTRESSQTLDNRSFNDSFKIYENLIYGYGSDGNIHAVAVDPSGNLSVELDGESESGVNQIDPATSTVTYVGQEDKDGVYIITKIDTSSGTEITYATITNNPTVTSYANAWAARASTLVFNYYSTAF